MRKATYTTGLHPRKIGKNFPTRALDDTRRVIYHWPACCCGRGQLEETPMTWEAPDFVEVKMDAEINSYQDDFGGEQDDRF